MGPIQSCEFIQYKIFYVDSVSNETKFSIFVINARTAGNTPIPFSNHELCQMAHSTLPRLVNLNSSGFFERLTAVPGSIDPNVQHVFLDYDTEFGRGNIGAT